MNYPKETHFWLTGACLGTLEVSNLQTWSGLFELTFIGVTIYCLKTMRREFNQLRHFQTSAQRETGKRSRIRVLAHRWDRHKNVRSNNCKGAGDKCDIGEVGVTSTNEGPLLLTVSQSEERNEAEICDLMWHKLHCWHYCIIDCVWAWTKKRKREILFWAESLCLKCRSHLVVCVACEETDMYCCGHLVNSAVWHSPQSPQVQCIELLSRAVPWMLQQQSL